MRYIRLDESNKIVAVRNGPTICSGEIESNTGELGQIMQIDGTFTNATIVQVVPQPTIEERLADMENTLDLILLKQEGIL